MVWIVREEKQHRCKPPVKKAFIDVDLFEMCDVNTWQDVWRCEEPDCGKYWVPKPSFPQRAHWEELKGWKLWWRLRKLS